MNKRKKLYLAHDLYRRKELRIYQRRMNFLSIKYKLINPFYDRNRYHIKLLDSGKANRWEFGIVECKDIVKHDKEMIRECDGVVAVITDNNFHVGTILEIGYADCLKKSIKPNFKIYVVSKKFYNHPWIRTYADKRFKNLDELAEFLLKGVFD